jgi:Cu+-exporting ATPase
MSEKSICYHCGDECVEKLMEADKVFCCNGCRQVYLLLNENNLCTYYRISDNPGIKVKGKFKSERFGYLDDKELQVKLASFTSAEKVNVNFYLPQVHCASCIFLLEQLHKIEHGIIQSQVNFQQKSILVSFNPCLISMRKVVELLAFIGYEPEISLHDSKKKKRYFSNKRELIRIGVAGFCFSNIMMLSFPEYFSNGLIMEEGLQRLFSLLIFALSLPVLLFSARSIFTPAWKGLKQRNINIDAPIALAILITFSRSYWEIFTHSGAGYLDSGTGIIFFMLIGRWFQGKTYAALSFERDYQSYFPLGVTVIRNQQEINIPLTQLTVADDIIIRHDEMIPADALLIEGEAEVDYSFVTGEDRSLVKQPGETVYAGGRQTGAAIKLKVTKAPSCSYISQLWNNPVFGKNKETEQSFIHPWSRHFTAVLLSIAALSASYWYITDPSKVWSVVTAVLIVACPCSLLLTATFTFGNMLRIFGRNKLYLKNATVIETLAGINHIVFDKTGTITRQEKSAVRFVGQELSSMDSAIVQRTASQSAHVLSATLSSHMKTTGVYPQPEIESFTEFPGRGISAETGGKQVRIGEAGFIRKGASPNMEGGAEIHLSIDNNYKGYFEIKHAYREGLAEMLASLPSHYQLHLLSGDNNNEQKNLAQLFGRKADMHFNMLPQEKLDYIRQLQQDGGKVLMVGDGLNDAGALMQSDAGLAVSENSARFSPACDGILDGSAVAKLATLLNYARSGRKIISIGFALSILYNVIGLSFAVQGKLSPVIAAILMPASSISLVSLAMLTSSLFSKRKGLK